MTVKEAVEKVLGLYPETRANDLKLIAYVWSYCYGIDHETALKVVSEANPNTICRIKRKIQEKERLNAQTEGGL